MKINSPGLAGSAGGCIAKARRNLDQRRDRF